jgi:hypothetical protein
MKEHRIEIADEIKRMINREYGKATASDDFIAGMEWVEYMIRNHEETISTEEHLLNFIKNMNKDRDK